MFPIDQPVCAALPGSTCRSPASVEKSRSIDGIGVERMESEALAATESMAREPSTTTPKIFDATLNLLHAPAECPAGARRHRAGSLLGLAMAVPAHNKRMRNSALRKWSWARSACRWDHWAALRAECRQIATPAAGIGPTPPLRVSRIADSKEPILTSY